MVALFVCRPIMAGEDKVGVIDTVSDGHWFVNYKVLNTYIQKEYIQLSQ